MPASVLAGTGSRSHGSLAVALALTVALAPSFVVAPSAGAAPSSGRVAPSALAAPSAPASRERTHRWPVQPAEVARRFEVAGADWLPGHRGVDLRATPGTVVAASAAGVVAHAGMVAGTAWVSIDHPGGVRTAYGPLATVEVATGDRVAAGDRIGTVAASTGHVGLHWSARRRGQYVDPLGLLAGVWVGSLVGPGGWSASGHVDRPGYEPWDGRATSWGRLPATGTATTPGWSHPPTPNHVVGIPGLGTATGSTPLPLDFLGYAPASITYLGHGGRTDRGPVDGRDPWRDQLPYGPLDTLAGVHASALGLRDQLRAQWAREPGVAVDLVGHSMGGVVAMHYLLALHDPADPTLPPIGNVVTLSSPLEGADLASAGRGVLGQWSGTRVAAELFAALLGAPLRGGTLDDLAVGSPLLRDLADAWADALDDRHASPLATGTRVLAVGGATDVVVPWHRSGLPGAEHVVVPGGHTAMHGSEATLQVVRAFLAEQVVPAGAHSWGAWTSGAWSVAQQLLGHVDLP